MNEQEFAELAAGYVLHALSPEDTDAFRTARRQHPEWEHLVTADAATAALLAQTVPAVTPPPTVRAALLAQIAGSGAPVEVEPVTTDAAAADAAAANAAETDAPAADPADPAETDAPTADAARTESPVAETPDAAATDSTSARNRSAGGAAGAQRRWGPRAWFVLAASLALLVGAGWGAVLVSQQLNPPASVVALDQIEAAPDAQAETVTLSDGGEATAHWSESVGKVVLVTEGLPTIAEDQSYELWFVRDGEPISAGIFAADDGSATALLSGTMEPGDVIAVTVEVAGGSPTGLPTSDAIVAIPTQDS